MRIFAMSRTAFLTAIALVAPLQADAAEPASESEESSRKTIQNALPYIEQKGAAWIEERNCVSCHRVAVMVWSLSAARDQGLDVDGEKLDGWVDWSLDALLTTREQDGKLVGSLNNDGVAQMLLYREAAGDDRRAEDYSQFVSLLINGQQEDGTWKPAGQLPSQKRPLAETTQASTLWSALALGSVARSDDVATTRQRAMDAIRDDESPISTEWYVARLLLAQQQSEAVEPWREKLVALQHEDGGWGWLTADESDALATGMALYALVKTRSAAGDANISTAIAWLIDSQQEDGSWQVRGTKEKKREGFEETAQYWGTCWAVIGLVEALPDR